MYHPTTRLLTMLELLQARGHLSGAELARRLEVDPRSIRRYVMMLQDLGIPVEGVRGPAGGYRLRPGTRLPPLLFTDDEAIVLTLSLLALPKLGVALDPAAVEGVRAKLERVLPEAVRERVRAVQTTVALPPAEPQSSVESRLITLLGSAIQQRRQVWLRYRSRDGEVTERVIDPYGVAHWSGTWYVVGYCHLRQDRRLFRLDRISAAEERAGTFDAPDSFDAYAYLVESFNEYPARWSTVVRLDLSLEEARQVVPDGYGTLEETADGVIVRSRIDDLDQMARWLAATPHPAVILDPPELRQAVRRLAAKLEAMGREV